MGEVTWLLQAGLQGDKNIEIPLQLFLFPAPLNPEYLWHHGVFVLFTKNTLPIQIFKIYMKAKMQKKKSDIRLANHLKSIVVYKIW